MSKSKKNEVIDSSLLLVKESTLPNCGKGLFTKVDIKKGALIVEYQGEGSIGRELLDGKTEVVINGQKVLVKGSVHNTQGLSSHADQNQLMEWLKSIKGVKKLVLTHGDEHSRIAFKEKVINSLGSSFAIKDVILPKLNEEITF